MKKSKKTLLIASTLAAALGATSCFPPENKPKKDIKFKIATFDPSQEEPEDVYGPPPTEFDPSDEDPVCVYGPPPTE